MSHFAQKRKERIEDLKNWITDEGPVSKEDAIDEAVAEYGVREEKAVEYIDVLKRKDVETYSENGEDMLKVPE